MVFTSCTFFLSMTWVKQKFGFELGFKRAKKIPGLGLKFLNTGAEETSLVPGSVQKSIHRKRIQMVLTKNPLRLEVTFSFWLPGLSPEKSDGKSVSTYWCTLSRAEWHTPEGEKTQHKLLIWHPWEEVKLTLTLMCLWSKGAVGAPSPRALEWNLKCFVTANVTGGTPVLNKRVDAESSV